MTKMFTTGESGGMICGYLLYHSCNTLQVWNKKNRVEKSFLALIIEQLTKDKRKKMCVYKFEMSEYKNKNKLEKLLQENMTAKETIF